MLPCFIIELTPLYLIISANCVCNHLCSVQRPRGEAEICTRPTERGAAAQDRGAARPGGGRPALSGTEGGGATATHRGDTRTRHRKAPPGGGAQEGHL